MKKLFELADLPIESNKPKVLLIYLLMDYRNTNNTNRFDDTALHLRPLLGFQYLAGASRTVGVESIILDRRIMRFDEKMVLELMKKHDPKLIGFYTSFALTKTNANFIREIRKHSNIPILVGGPGYSDHDEVLQAGADAVCVGEGEATYTHVLQKVLANDRNWSDVEGLIRLEDGKIVHNAPRALIDVNKNVWPARGGLVPVSHYVDYMVPGFRAPYVTMLASRGCPYRCTFCDSPNIWQKEVRQRTPDNLIAEIDYAVENWDIRFIDFLDDVFGLTPKWLEEFADKMSARRYDLHFKMLCNPRTFGTRRREALTHAARAGANSIGIGMQSADASTLTFINRDADTPARLKETVDIAHANGMMTYVPFIVGFPEEPVDTPEKIMELIDDVRPMVIDCYPLIYLKDTALEKGLAEGKFKDTYPYLERVERARRVKKHFYSSPRNVGRFFLWLCRRNPTWLVYMVFHLPFFWKFVFSSKEATPVGQELTHPMH